MKYPLQGKGKVVLVEPEGKLGNERKKLYALSGKGKESVFGKEARDPTRRGGELLETPCGSQPQKKKPLEGKEKRAS